MKCRWSRISANSEIPRPVVPNRDFRTHTSLGTQRSPSKKRAGLFALEPRFAYYSENASARRSYKTSP